MMYDDLEKVLVTHDEILEICKKLGKQITNDYKDSKRLMLVALLKGSVPFIADLMKEIDLPLEVEYMDVSSYHGGVASSGEVKILKDLDSPIAQCDVLIVEDIVDTGKTLNVVTKLLDQRGANSVKVVSLVDKPGNRVVAFDVDYVGVTLGNEFLVGYGLDYLEKYRNLKCVGILKKEIYLEEV